MESIECQCCGAKFDANGSMKDYIEEYGMCKICDEEEE